MFRFVVLLLALVCAAAFTPAPLQLSKVADSRAAVSMMARGAPKKAVKKAAPKKAPARKSSGSTEGKGGIFPWITNEPGTYGKPLKLSSVDFTSDEGDAWIGWGFMPKSVKNTLYPKGYKGLLNK